jgi:ribonuclease BN (tRNA processing enzyme)
MICISHLHADHHLGTIKLLLAHRQLYCDNYNDKQNDKYTPITIIAPKLFQAWLRDYSQTQPLLYSFIDCAALQYNCYCMDSQGVQYNCNSMDSESVDSSSSARVEVQQQLGVAVRSVRVIHCPDAFAFVLQSKHWKLVYARLSCQSLVSV